MSWANMGAVLPRKREPRVSGEKACDPGFPPSREHKEARSHVRSCWACRSTAFPTSREERPFDKLRACPGLDPGANGGRLRSEEHTSELQSLMRISYAVFCLKKNRHSTPHAQTN